MAYHLVPKNLKKETIRSSPTYQQPDQTEVDGLEGIVGSFPPRVLLTTNA